MIITAALSIAAVPAVDLVVAAFPGGTASVRVWRTYDGQRSTVRDADGALTGGAPSRPYTDSDAPFGYPTSYIAYAYNSVGAVLASAQSAPVTLDIDVPWISDPLAPGRACAVSPINESLQEITHDVQGEVAQVVQSGLPVAVMGVVGVASSVPLRFAAPTALQGQMIRTVLRSANPILLRIPTKDNYQIPALCYVAFTSYSDIKVGGEHDHIALAGTVAVAPPLSPVVLAPRTYGDLRGEASAYGDVPLLYAKYLNVLRGN